MKQFHPLTIERIRPETADSVRITLDVPDELVGVFASLIAVGSIAGMFPTPTSATYGASKAFVNNFTESLRIELRGTGVATHVLAPGPVATEFFADVEAHQQKYGAFFVPTRRVADEALDRALRGERAAFEFDSLVVHGYSFGVEYIW